MSGRARLILAGAGVVLVLALFFFLFIRGRQGELAQVRTEIEAEENRAVQLTAELNRLKSLQEKAPELQAELSRIRQLVPVEHDIPHFMFLVQDAATEAGVSFLSVAPQLPKAPPEGAPLAQVNVAITADGGFFALQDFLRRLYALDRATRIDNFAMGAGDEAPGANIEIALDAAIRIFFELPAPPDAATGAEPNVPPPTAPVDGATPAPATSP